MATAPTPILVTGAAGFVGFHLSRRLLNDGREVVGVDSLNEYYDRRLKEARLDELRRQSGFRFAELNLADRQGTTRLFDDVRPELVAHLAAQAGVRYSLEAPHAYTESNLVALANVLESCRQHGVRHLTFASSSSVYGANTVLPFSEHHGADHPLSLYAATKRSGELMGYAYSHLFDLPFTALRFFTVYGPWGRPDMALFKFTKAILEGQPIEVFHHGESARDYTYVTDTVDGVLACTEQTFGCEIFNLGESQTVKLNYLIELLEESLGKKAIVDHRPPEAGDVPITFADISKAQRALGYNPRTKIQEGIPQFIEWFRRSMIA